MDQHEVHHPESSHKHRQPLQASGKLKKCVRTDLLSFQALIDPFDPETNNVAIDTSQQQKVFSTEGLSVKEVKEIVPTLSTLNRLRPLAPFSQFSQERYLNSLSQFSSDNPPKGTSSSLHSSSNTAPSTKNQSARMTSRSDDLRPNEFSLTSKIDTLSTVLENVKKWRQAVSLLFLSHESELATSYFGSAPRNTNDKPLRDKCSLQDALDLESEGLVLETHCHLPELPRLKNLLVKARKLQSRIQRAFQIPSLPLPPKFTPNEKKKPTPEILQQLLSQCEMLPLLLPETLFLRTQLETANAWNDSLQFAVASHSLEACEAVVNESKNVLVQLSGHVELGHQILASTWLGKAEKVGQRGVKLATLEELLSDPCAMDVSMREHPVVVSLYRRLNAAQRVLGILERDRLGVVLETSWEIMLQKVMNLLMKECRIDMWAGWEGEEKEEVEEDEGEKKDRGKRKTKQEKKTEKAAEALHLPSDLLALPDRVKREIGEKDDWEKAMRMVESMAEIPACRSISSVFRQNVMKCLLCTYSESGFSPLVWQGKTETIVLESSDYILGHLRQTASLRLTPREIFSVWDAFTEAKVQIFTTQVKALDQFIRRLRRWHIRVQTCVAALLSSTPLPSGMSYAVGGSAPAGGASLGIAEALSCLQEGIAWASILDVTQSLSELLLLVVPPVSWICRTTQTLSQTKLIDIKNKSSRLYANEKQLDFDALKKKGILRTEELRILVNHTPPAQRVQLKEVQALIDECDQEKNPNFTCPMPELLVILQEVWERGQLWPRLAKQSLDRIRNGFLLRFVGKGRGELESSGEIMTLVLLYYVTLHLCISVDLEKELREILLYLLWRQDVLSLGSNSANFPPPLAIVEELSQRPYLMHFEHLCDTKTSVLDLFTLQQNEGRRGERRGYPLGEIVEVSEKVEETLLPWETLRLSTIHEKVELAEAWTNLLLLPELEFIKKLFEIGTEQRKHVQHSLSECEKQKAPFATIKSLISNLQSLPVALHDELQMLLNLEKEVYRLISLSQKFSSLLESGGVTISDLTILQKDIENCPVEIFCEPKLESRLQDVFTTECFAKTLISQNGVHAISRFVELRTILGGRGLIVMNEATEKVGWNRAMVLLRSRREAREQRERSGRIEVDGEDEKMEDEMPHSRDMDMYDLALEWMHYKANPEDRKLFGEGGSKKEKGEKELSLHELFNYLSRQNQISEQLVSLPCCEQAIRCLYLAEQWLHDYHILKEKSLIHKPLPLSIWKEFAAQGKTLIIHISGVEELVRDCEVAEAWWELVTRIKQVPQWRVQTGLEALVGAEEGKGTVKTNVKRSLLKKYAQEEGLLPVRSLNLGEGEILVSVVESGYVQLGRRIDVGEELEREVREGRMMWERMLSLLERVIELRTTLVSVVERFLVWKRTHGCHPEGSGEVVAEKVCDLMQTVWKENYVGEDAEERTRDEEKTSAEWREVTKEWGSLKERWREIGLEYDALSFGKIQLNITEAFQWHKSLIQNEFQIVYYILFSSHYTIEEANDFLRTCSSTTYPSLLVMHPYDSLSSFQVLEEELQSHVGDSLDAQFVGPNLLRLEKANRLKGETLEADLCSLLNLVSRDASTAHPSLTLNQPSSSAKERIQQVVSQMEAAGYKLSESLVAALKSEMEITSEWVNKVQRLNVQSRLDKGLLEWEQKLQQRLISLDNRVYGLYFKAMIQDFIASPCNVSSIQAMILGSQSSMNPPTTERPYAHSFQSALDYNSDRTVRHHNSVVLSNLGDRKAILCAGEYFAAQKGKEFDQEKFEKSIAQYVESDLPYHLSSMESYELSPPPPPIPPAAPTLITPVVTQIEKQEITEVIEDVTPAPATTVTRGRRKGQVSKKSTIIPIEQPPAVELIVENEQVATAQPQRQAMKEMIVEVEAEKDDGRNYDAVYGWDLDMQKLFYSLSEAARHAIANAVESLENIVEVKQTRKLLPCVEDALFLLIGSFQWNCFRHSFQKLLCRNVLISILWHVALVESHPFLRTYVGDKVEESAEEVSLTGSSVKGVDYTVIKGEVESLMEGHTNILTDLSTGDTASYAKDFVENVCRSLSPEVSQLVASKTLLPATAEQPSEMPTPVVPISPPPHASVYLSYPGVAAWETTLSFKLVEVRAQDLPPPVRKPKSHKKQQVYVITPAPLAVSLLSMPADLDPEKVIQRSLVEYNPLLASTNATLASKHPNRRVSCQTLVEWMMECDSLPLQIPLKCRLLDCLQKALRLQILSRETLYLFSSHFFHRSFQELPNRVERMMQLLGVSKSYKYEKKEEVEVPESTSAIISDAMQVDGEDKAFSSGADEAPHKEERMVDDEEVSNTPLEQPIELETEKVGVKRGIVETKQEVIESALGSFPSLPRISTMDLTADDPPIKRAKVEMEETMELQLPRPIEMPPKPFSTAVHPHLHVINIPRVTFKSIPYPASDCLSCYYNPQQEQSVCETTLCAISNLPSSLPDKYRKEIQTRITQVRNSMHSISHLSQMRKTQISSSFTDINQTLNKNLSSPLLTLLGNSNSQSDNSFLAVPPLLALSPVQSLFLMSYHAHTQLLLITPDLCHLCARDPDSDKRNPHMSGNWVRCDTCCNWLHIECAALSQPFNDILSQGEFVCSFCQVQDYLHAPVISEKKKFDNALTTIRASPWTKDLPGRHFASWKKLLFLLLALSQPGMANIRLQEHSLLIQRLAGFLQWLELYGENFSSLQETKAHIHRLVDCSFPVSRPLLEDTTLNGIALACLDQIFVEENWQQDIRLTTLEEHSWVVPCLNEKLLKKAQHPVSVINIPFSQGTVYLHHGRTKLNVQGNKMLERILFLLGMRDGVGELNRGEEEEIKELPLEPELKPEEDDTIVDILLGEGPSQVLRATTTQVINLLKHYLRMFHTSFHKQSVRQPFLSTVDYAIDVKLISSRRLLMARNGRISVEVFYSLDSFLKQRLDNEILTLEQKSVYDTWNKVLRRLKYLEYDCCQHIVACLESSEQEEERRRLFVPVLREYLMKPLIVRAESAFFFFTLSSNLKIFGDTYLQKLCTKIGAPWEGFLNPMLPGGALHPSAVFNTIQDVRSLWTPFNGETEFFKHSDAFFEAVRTLLMFRDATQAVLSSDLIVHTPIARELDRIMKEITIVANHIYMIHIRAKKLDSLCENSPLTNVQVLNCLLEVRALEEKWSKRVFVSVEEILNEIGFGSKDPTKEKHSKINEKEDAARKEKDRVSLYLTKQMVEVIRAQPVCTPNMIKWETTLREVEWAIGAVEFAERKIRAEDKKYEKAGDRAEEKKKKIYPSVGRLSFIADIITKSIIKIPDIDGIDIATCVTTDISKVVNWAHTSRSLCNYLMQGYNKETYDMLVQCMKDALDLPIDISKLKYYATAQTVLASFVPPEDSLTSSPGALPPPTQSPSPPPTEPSTGNVILGSASLGKTAQSQGASSQMGASSQGTMPSGIGGGGPVLPSPNIGGNVLNTSSGTAPVLPSPNVNGALIGSSHMNTPVLPSPNVGGSEMNAANGGGTGLPNASMGGTGLSNGSMGGGNGSGGGVVGVPVGGSLMGTGSVPNGGIANGMSGFVTGGNVLSGFGPGGGHLNYGGDANNFANFANNANAGNLFAALAANGGMMNNMDPANFANILNHVANSANNANILNHVANGANNANNANIMSALMAMANSANANNANMANVVSALATMANNANMENNYINFSANPNFNNSAALANTIASLANNANNANIANALASLANNANNNNFANFANNNPHKNITQTLPRISMITSPNNPSNAPNTNANTLPLISSQFYGTGNQISPYLPFINTANAAANPTATMFNSNYLLPSIPNAGASRSFYINSSSPPSTSSISPTSPPTPSSPSPPSPTPSTQNQTE